MKPWPRRPTRRALAGACALASLLLLAAAGLRAEEPFYQREFPPEEFRARWERLFDAIGPEAAALHAFGVGAVGGMIVGMITRTALGHTGRPLHAGPMETSAYVLVHAAALLRVVPLLIVPALYPSALVASGVLWSAGFAFYLARYAPLLTSARPDGKPG